MLDVSIEKLKPFISSPFKFVHSLRKFPILFSSDVLKLLRFTNDNSEQPSNIETILVKDGAFKLDKSIKYKELSLNIF